MVWQPHHYKKQEVFNEMKNEINKTAHSTYRCEYHIVFAPKYRRQIV